MLDERRTLERLAPLTVVVPNVRIGSALRHRIARRPNTGAKGIVNVRFLTLAAIAEELGSALCRRSTRRKVTRVTLGAAARVALRGHRGFLARVVDEPSTEEEIVALYEELRQLEGDAFDALRRRGGHCVEIADLLFATRREIEGHWFDDADLVEAATEALDGGARLDEFGANFIVHLPERVRPDEARLIAVLAKSCELVVHLGVVEDPSADAPILSIGATLAVAGLQVLEPPSRSASDPLGPDEPIAIAERIEARDAESEVRAAVRVVLESLEVGIAPERIALLYSSRRTYLRLLARGLDDAGIAWSGPSAIGVAETATARTLSGLVELSKTELDRDAVMAWLRSVPLCRGDGRRVPVGDWEIVSRRAGIVSGDADEWCRHLDSLAFELRRGRRPRAVGARFARTERACTPRQRDRGPRGASEPDDVHR